MFVEKITGNTIRLRRESYKELIDWLLQTFETSGFGGRELRRMFFYPFVHMGQSGVSSCTTDCVNSE